MDTQAAEQPGKVLPSLPGSSDREQVSACTPTFQNYHFPSLDKCVNHTPRCVLVKATVRVQFFPAQKSH